MFATSELVTGLMKLSPVDGQVSELTRPDGTKGEVDHVFPDLLPQGRGVLFTILKNTDSAADAQVAVFDARTQKYKTLIQSGSHPKFVAPGYLVFGSGGSLRAVNFDLEQLDVSGTPVPVLEGVTVKPSGSVPFTVANNGTLAYFGTGQEQKRALVWVDAAGREEAVGPEPAKYVWPAVSPDGSRVAVSLEGANGNEADIWIWSVTSRTFSRLTFDTGAELQALWMPDSRRLVYESLANGANLMSRSADGTGTPEPLLAPDPQRLRVSPSSWTPDGRLLFEERLRGEDRIGVVSPGSAASVVMSETKFRVTGSSLSPDGRWLAYVSTESVGGLAYVRPFPNVQGGKWQVSRRGASATRWSQDGRVLYVVGQRIMAGKVTTTPSFAVSDLTPLSQIGLLSDFALGPDGRLLLVRPQEAGSVPTLNIVLNWTTGLASLLASN